MENETTEKELLDNRDTQNESPKNSKMMSVKSAIILAVILILLALVYAYKGFFILATVYGSPITRLAAVNELERAYGKELLESLINEKIIQNEANLKKIVVTDEEINAAIKPIEEQIKAQGGTLEAALTQKGMKLDDLKKQIILQKDIEKLLADKITVTDEEVAKFIKENKPPIPKEQEATLNLQIKEQIKNQKMQSEAQSYITELRAKAKISYFVNY